MSKRDYYEVLGVQREANTDEIERAYRKLARQFHPDRNIGDTEAEGKFKEVTEAHEVLVNVEKRQRYDRYGHAGLDPNDTGFGPGGSFQDIVSDLFSAFVGGGSQRRRGQGGARRGGDRRHVIDVELHEVIAEVKKSVTLRRLELCGECSGKGTKTGKRMT